MVLDLIDKDFFSFDNRTGRNVIISGVNCECECDKLCHVGGYLDY